MPNKGEKAQKDNIQRLVVFEPKIIPKDKIVDKYTIEKTDQIEKIKIVNKLSPRGVHYNYSILIDNQSSTLILNTRVRILYPKFLEYSKCFPPAIRVFSPIEHEGEEIKRIDLEFEILRQNSSKKIQLLFTSSTKEGLGEFRTLIAYEKRKGKIKAIKSDPLRIQIEKPEITPKIISSASIREFSHNRGVKRNLISLGFGTSKKGALDKYLGILEHLFLLYNFQLIIKEEERGILWYFGNQKQSGYDILALGKIFSNRIEVMVMSENPIILVSLLSLFTENLKEELLTKKFVKSEKLIFDLDCINCGTFLPFFPRKGETIECDKCNYKQIVW